MAYLPISFVFFPVVFPELGGVNGCDGLFERREYFASGHVPAGSGKAKILWAGVYCPQGLEGLP